MDVSSWLRDLGLQDCAHAFRADDIDTEVLPRLTAEDLIALGIASGGGLQGGAAPAGSGGPARRSDRPRRIAGG